VRQGRQHGGRVTQQGGCDVCTNNRRGADLQRATLKRAP
jgi:hypothetical protein